MESVYSSLQRMGNSAACIFLLMSAVPFLSNWDASIFPNRILVLVVIEQQLRRAFPSLFSPVYFISVTKLGCMMGLVDLVLRDHSGSLHCFESSFPVMEESICPPQKSSGNTDCSHFHCCCFIVINVYGNCRADYSDQYQF